VNEKLHKRETIFSVEEVKKKTTEALTGIQEVEFKNMTNGINVGTNRDHLMESSLNAIFKFY